MVAQPNWNDIFSIDSMLYRCLKCNFLCLTGNFNLHHRKIHVFHRPLNFQQIKHQCFLHYINRNCISNEQTSERTRWKKNRIEFTVIPTPILPEVADKHFLAHPIDALFNCPPGKSEEQKKKEIGFCLNAANVLKNTQNIFLIMFVRHVRPHATVRVPKIFERASTRNSFGSFPQRQRRQRPDLSGSISTLSNNNKTLVVVECE